MKVIMFLNSRLSGDQRVYKEARTLADAGHQVSILVNQEPEAPSPVWDGINVISLPRRPSLFFPARFTFSWIKTALNFNPDIIHAHDLNTLGRAWLVAKLCRARLIYDSHDYFLETQFVLRMPSWRKWYYRRKEGFLIRRSDCVIHVVPGLCSLAAKEFRISDPLLVANFPMGDYPVQNKVLHEMFELTQETKIAIYEGVMVKDRGLEKLVKSAKYFPPGIVIVFLGEGYLKDKLKKLSEELGVKDKVKFIKDIKLEQFPHYCAAADIGISIHENVGLSDANGWPTKVFNYMRAGLPTLIRGCTSMEKLVKENQAGLIIEDITPEGISRAIIELISDSNRMDSLSRNALSSWKNKFNWDTEARKLLGLYAGFEM